MSGQDETPEGQVADAVIAATGLITLRARGWSRPYLRLSRADRPIGTWLLLLLPCWWGFGAGTSAYATAPFDPAIPLDCRGLCHRRVPDARGGVYLERHHRP